MSLRVRKRADKSGSPPPRNLPVDGKLTNPDLPRGALLEPWPLAGVDIEGDPPPRHHFATQWVTQAIVEGWLTVTQGQIVLHTLEGDVAYRIESGPGAFCCHCGDKVGDGATSSSSEAQRRIDYVKTCQVYNNPDDTDDPANPSGYEVRNYYVGVLDNG